MYAKRKTEKWNLRREEIVKKEEALFEGKRTFILKKHVQVNQFAKMGRLGLS